MTIGAEVKPVLFPFRGVAFWQREEVLESSDISRSKSMSFYTWASLAVVTLGLSVFGLSTSAPVSWNLAQKWLPVGWLMLKGWAISIWLLTACKDLLLWSGLECTTLAWCQVFMSGQSWSRCSLCKPSTGCHVVICLCSKRMMKGKMTLISARKCH